MSLSASLTTNLNSPEENQDHYREWGDEQLVRGANGSTKLKEKNGRRIRFRLPGGRAIATRTEREKDGRKLYKPAGGSSLPGEVRTADRKDRRSCSSVVGRRFCYLRPLRQNRTRVGSSSSSLFASFKQKDHE